MPTYNYTLPSHTVTHERVRVSTLQVNPDAQRVLNLRRAQNMAKAFVPEAAGTIVINRRDGIDYVVDGYHRKTAAELAEGPEAEMDAEVHHGLTEEQEAQLFLMKNKESTKPNNADEYRIGLTAKIPLYLDTQAVLERHGLRMQSNGSSVSNVRAISAVVNIVEQFGPLTLDKSLSVAEAAFGRTEKTWDGMILAGLGRLIGRHDEDIDLTVLIKRLGKWTANRWIQEINSVASVNNSQGTGTGGRASAAYRLFLVAYNSGKKTNRLAESA